MTFFLYLSDVEEGGESDVIILPKLDSLCRSLIQLLTYFKTGFRRDELSRPQNRRHAESREGCSLAISVGQ